MYQIRNNHFIDDDGRIVLLRGVNLGGSSKVPVSPHGATWNPNSFLDPYGVSFVGRPFPLEEADEHFSRLRSWGFNFLRFLVTWEAIEHAGPGRYDEAYLDYLHAVIKKAGEHDFLLFIDPHQDAWSRFSGGDGAPAWTFDRLGMDFKKFHAAGAAFTHQDCGDPYPVMIWPSNYGRYAAATMFTLFFGGNTFAPHLKVDGVPVQEFLQGHYIGAVRQVVERLKEFSHVLGYDTLNEPSQGFIGCADANQIPLEVVAQGPMPTIYQSLLVASGFPQEVAYRAEKFPWSRRSKVRLNEGGVSIFHPGFGCPWKEHGVWGVDRSGNPQLLKPDYFGVVDGKPVDFDRQFFEPFVRRYTQEIRQVDPKALIFVSPAPAEMHTGAEGFSLGDLPGMVFAPHWYDGVTLSFKKYFSWLGVDTSRHPMKIALGRQNRVDLFTRQIGMQVQRARRDLGSAPVVIGETGIPFDLDGKKAYQTGKFEQQEKAMDDVIQALDRNFVNYTLWNYTADNDNHRGDQWNNEDLSIFSRDQLTGSGSLEDGGRALKAVIRACVRRVPGELVMVYFDYTCGFFQVDYRPDLSIQAPLEIFIPKWIYPLGVRVHTTKGRTEVNLDEEWVRYYADGAVPVCSIVIQKRNPIFREKF